MNATETGTSTNRLVTTLARSNSKHSDRTQNRRKQGNSRSGCTRLSNRARRKLLRQQGLQRTIIQQCGITPLSGSEAAEHRERVKTQFFADLEEWQRTPPGVTHFLLRGWKFPVSILAAGILLGLFFGAMFAWIGLASVLGFVGWLHEAVDETAKTQRLRRQTADRIKVHAKWKIGQAWTNVPYEMFHLLEAFDAPAQLKSAVLKIEAAHPEAEFQIEVFDEDPILWVRKHDPGMPPEHYVLGVWGLPKKFTFV